MACIFNPRHSHFQCMNAVQCDILLVIVAGIWLMHLDVFLCTTVFVTLIMQFITSAQRYGDLQNICN